MQDRYLVIAIILVIAICCLGGYVAISGFLNTNAPAFSGLTPGIASTPIVVAVSTDTPAPAKTATSAASGATAVPVPSPLGAFQTIAAGTTQQPAAPTLASRPANTPTAAPAALGQSCAGFSFCSKGGPPDFTLGPTSDCPTNFIWGRVTDKNGSGMPNMRIRFKLIATGESDSVVSKGLPDPPGVYNIPTGQPGSAWVLWVVDAGNPISPQVNIVTQKYGGTGNCPTRVDFVQQ